MFGLLGFGSIAVWFALSLWVAWRAARLVKQIWLKALVFLALGPLLFVAPVADELIGNYQFKRYCKEADEVKIYGTIPVGEDFYTADGKWKPADPKRPLEESNRLQAVLHSIVRWDLGSSYGTQVPAVIPIHYYETKMYEIRTGRLLAEFRIYSSGGGGWLSRSVFERPALMAAQCRPRLVREGYIEQSILPFNGNVGGAK
jgi:hypothetical protein